MKLLHQLRFVFALASLAVPFVVHAVPDDRVGQWSDVVSIPVAG